MKLTEARSLEEKLWEILVQFSSLRCLSRVWLFATPCTAARQASLSITNSRSPPKPMSIVSVMPSSYLIFGRPLLLTPSISPSIRVFSNESALCIRWPKYWSFSFSISSYNEYSGLISFRIDWLDLSISWLQAPFTVILEPKKINCHCFHYFSISICHEVMGLDAIILVFWM